MKPPYNQIDLMKMSNRMEFSLGHLLEILRVLKVISQRQVDEIVDDYHLRTRYLKSNADRVLRGQIHEAEVAKQRARLY